MKPSLHEIAAMPFPESLGALRRHYDRDWGSRVSDEPESWTVHVDYTVTSRDSMSVTVNAHSVEEAKRFGSELVGELADGDDFEVEYVRARSVEQQSPALGAPLLDLVPRTAVH